MKYCPVCEEEIEIVGSDEYGYDIYDCVNMCDKENRELDEMLEFFI